MVLISIKSYAQKEKHKIKLFDDDIVHKIEITINHENYNKKLSSYKTNRATENKYFLANIIIDSTEINNIGIRYKGESSFDFVTTLKKSFKIDFNAFVLGKKYQGYSKINLNNNFKDPTQIREKLFLDLLKKLNQPYQKNAFAAVYVNSDYIGLYLMTEDINKKFLKRNFDQNNGTFIKGSPKADLNIFTDTEKSYKEYYSLENKINKKKHWKKLISFIKKINKGDKDYYSKIEPILNIENTITQWALNNCIANTDSFNMGHAHNFYLYFGKKIEWISYDGNYSFGAFEKGFNLTNFIEADLYSTKIAPQNPVLVHFFINDKTIREKYKQIIDSKIIPILESQKFLSSIEKYKNLISNYVKTEKYGFYSYDDFLLSYNNNIGDINDPGAFSPGLTTFIKQRVEYIKYKTKDFN